jgi:hypothetical protein
VPRENRREKGVFILDRECRGERKGRTRGRPFSDHRKQKVEERQMR